MPELFAARGRRSSLTYPPQPKAPTPGAMATGVLTFSGNAANTQTVTIDGKVYTFQTTLTNVDGNVLVGATTADSIANLAAAINRGASAGTFYAAATTKHPTVFAQPAATTLTVWARTGGTAGNSITTTETLANASWGGATLSGGAALPLTVTTTPQLVGPFESGAVMMAIVTTVCHARMFREGETIVGATTSDVLLPINTVASPLVFPTLDGDMLSIRTASGTATLHCSQGRAD